MSNAATVTTVPAYLTSAIADGYIYECACGELYKMAAGALCCRKCRNYCVFGYCTHVVDITTGEVVAGTEPTAAEYEEAVVLAEANRAEEREEWEHQLALMQGDGELYEQIMAKRAAEAVTAACNLAMDNHYAIQDELSGY